MGAPFVLLQGQGLAVELGVVLILQVTDVSPGPWVRVSGKRIAITRGNREVAPLVPTRNEGASGAELLELLRSNPLTECTYQTSLQFSSTRSKR